MWRNVYSYCPEPRIFQKTGRQAVGAETEQALHWCTTKLKNTKAIRSNAAARAIAEARDDLASYLDTLAGLGDEIRATPTPFGPNTRIVEVTQEVNVVGKKGTADKYAKAVCVSANPLCPIVVVYRNAAGSSEYVDFGDLDANGAHVADQGFSNLCDDNGLGTVFAQLGVKTSDSTFKAIYPTFKAFNCIGGHCAVTSYGNITNTVGYVRTFEVENRNQWTLGDGGDEIIVMATDANGMRMSGYEKVSAYSLSTVTDGGRYYAIAPSVINDRPNEIPPLITGAPIGWDTSATTLIETPSCALPLALNLPLSAPFGLSRTGADHGWASGVITSGVCDPDYDLRLFDVSSIGDDTSITFSVRLLFAIEPYVSRMSLFAAPSAGLKHNHEKASVAKAVMSQAKKSGRTKSGWRSFIDSAARAGKQMLMGSDGKFDLGDALRLAQTIGSVGMGVATENPAYLLPAMRSMGLLTM